MALRTNQGYLGAVSGTEPVERYLHEQIPLSAAMGVRVLSLDGAGVRLALPLAPNVNHRHTAFGGSIVSAAILAAWTLVHTRLASGGLPARVVIQRTSAEFLRPVTGDCEAFCPSPDEARWRRFADTLRRHGKARLRLESRLLQDGAEAATLQGEFVAVLSSTDPPAG